MVDIVLSVLAHTTEDSVLPPFAGNGAESCCGISPVSPIAARIIELMAKEDPDFRELTDVLRADPSCSAALLTTANSPLFGVSSPIHSVDRAVLMMGLERTRSIALSLVVRSFVLQFGSAPEYRRIWEHSLAAAMFSEHLADLTGTTKDIAYTSALMHDIGRIAMLKTLGVPYTALLQQEHDTSESLEAEESAAFGFSHSQVGFLLAKTWRFPESLQHRIMKHHHRGETLQRLTCALADAAGYAAVRYRQAEPVDLWDPPPSLAVRRWIQERFPAVSREIANRIRLF